jgi:hypothetical protein
MGTMNRASILVSALALSASAALGDDTLRCGNAIIDVGMVAAQVVDRCGEPKSKEVEEVPVRQRTKSGGVNTIGSTRVERWTYERGYGQFPALLTFEAGKLKSIELLTRR